MVDDLGIAAGLTLFCVEIFDRFVVQQTVHRLGDGLGVQLVHFLTQFVAPVGDHGGVGDVADNHDQRGDNHAPTKRNLEIHRNQKQLKQCRRDVEKQEIEHDIDALRSALNDLGHCACPPVHVEAHRQIVQMAEHIFGQTPRGFLPDAFKYHVAQIVEQHAAKTRASISRDQCDGDRHAVFHARNHPVNGPAVDPRHAELD